MEYHLYEWFIQDDDEYYVAVAHCDEGSIPGKAKDGNCWYPFGGEERETDNFSWVVAERLAPLLITDLSWTPGKWSSYFGSRMKQNLARNTYYRTNMNGNYWITIN